MTIPAGYAQVSMLYTGAGAPTGAANVFGVALEDPADTPTTVGAKALTAWVNGILGSLTDDVVVSGVLVKFGPDDTGPFALSSANENGDVGTTSVAPNTSFLASKVTGIGGRRGRGRLYLPGVAESAINDAGDLIGSWPTDVQTDLTASLASLTANDVPMVVLHSPATEWVLVDGQPKRVPVAGALPVPSTVTNLVIQSRAATQRRRLRR